MLTRWAGVVAALRNPRLSGGRDRVEAMFRMYSDAESAEFGVLGESFARCMLFRASGRPARRG